MYHTGKKKVLHWARLLLWLTDYGEPVRCNLINISNRAPGPTPDQCPHEGSENDDSVQSCRTFAVWLGFDCVPSCN